MRLPGSASPARGGSDLEPDELPVVLHVSTMSRAEKAKLKRVIQPKPNSGRLEVPKDIMLKWNSEKGKKELMDLWAKSGGVKAGLGQ